MSVIELNIVPDKNFSLSELYEFFGYFKKARRALYHFVGNAGELCDKWRNVALGVDERGKYFSYFFAIENNAAYFGNTATLCETSTGGFDIDYCKHGMKVRNLGVRSWRFELRRDVKVKTEGSPIYFLRALHA